ncbi:neuroglobin-like [Gigantopelta aegis]|uniref:neuroglobin-like n=1 Tax=Gigantopelta aegis TaxID=1735272 RepID=UPI001B88DE6F|nr:neuroglobin-like [Gigantopelta aegis]
MGTAQSISCIETNEKDLSVYLTPRQISLVQETWHQINDDLPKLGLLIFLKFFQTEPEMKSLFPKIIKMNESNQLEWDIDNEMLTKHAVTVLEGLGAAVENLDDSDFLNSVLISIGQTHVKRNVKPQMLKKLWPSLQHGLRVTLGDRYTKEVNESWKRVYQYIGIQMRKGMENPDAEFNENIVT